MKRNTNLIKQGSKKNIAFSLISFLIVLLSIELISYLAITFISKNENIQFTHSKTSTMSLFKTIYKQYISNKNAFDKVKSDPYPFFIADKKHGYIMRPGSYTFTYTKQKKGVKSFFKNKVTIEKNNQRYIGRSSLNTSKDVFIFGDSFIFGEGVNDEQTFTFLLQNKFPNFKFHLYATGGYSLSNAYINFQQVKSKIKKGDIVILGYADYFKVRHVAAPSRLKAYGKPSSIITNPEIKHLRANIGSQNDLYFDYVPIFCEKSKGYCNNIDPSEDYMNQVAIKLINTIKQESLAEIILFHFSGSKDDPVLKGINKNITTIEATKIDFDYEINDDIMGFDAHPGPFWHYAMFLKLVDYLKNY